MVDPSSAEFFEAKYRDAPDTDPWQFETSPYEQGRYDVIVTALAGRMYNKAFEPGCSIGVLTEKLSALCHEIDACDISPSAVAVATERCKKYPGVSIHCAGLTGNAPWSRYDLIVLCEIGYYFTEQQWQTLVENMVSGMQLGARVLMSHWSGSSPDHLQSASVVHRTLQQPELCLVLSEHHEGFLLEQWTKVKDVIR